MVFLIKYDVVSSALFGRQQDISGSSGIIASGEVILY